MSKGYTLVELILVIAIMGILFAAASPFLSRFILQNNIEIAESNVIGSVRKAQEYSMDGRDDSVWGMCLSDGDVRIFTGTCASPTFSEDLSISDSVTVAGLNEIIFSKLRGEPSSSLSITISTAIDSTTIDLNAAGGVDVN